MRFIAALILFTILTVTGCAATRAATDFLLRREPAPVGSTEEQPSRLERLATALLPVAQLLGFGAAGAASAIGAEKAADLYARRKGVPPVA